MRTIAQRWKNLFAGLYFRLGVIFFIAILPTLHLVTWQNIELRTAQRSAATKRAMLIADKVAETHADIIRDTELVLARLKGISPARLGSMPECQDIFARVVGDNLWLIDSWITDESGRTLCSDLGDRVFDRSDRQDFIDAITNDRFSIGQYRVGPVTRRAAMPVSLPIHDTEGRVVGTLGATIEISWISSILKRQEIILGQSEELSEMVISIFDSDRTILYRSHEHDKFVGKKFPETIPVDFNSIGFPGPGLDGVRRIFSGRVMSNPDIAIRVGAPEEGFLPPAFEKARLLAPVVYLSLLFCGVFLFWSLGRFVIQPVNALLLAARRIGSSVEHSSTPMGLSAPGEIDQLSHEIEAMGEELRQREIRREENTKKLLDSEERYRSMVEGIDDLYFESDLKGNATFISPSAKNVIGFEPSELMGTNLADLCADPVARAAFRDKLMGDERFVRDLRMPSHRKNREPVWISISAHLMCDTDGVPYGIAGLVRDISDSIETENSLRMSDNFLRSVTDNIPVSITYTDKNKIFRFANRTAETWIGLPKEKIVGGTYEMFIKHAGRLIDYGALTLKGETTTSESYISFAHNRQSRWVETTRIPDRDEQGAVRGFFRLAIDISERKENEKLLRESEALKSSVLDSVAGSLAVLDTHGTIIAVNRGWCEFARNNGSDDLAENSVGMNYLAACRPYAGVGPDAEADAAGACIRQILIGEKKEFTQEYRCDSPTEPRWYRMIVTPLLGPSGGAVVSHHDITEVKLAEGALQQAQKLEAIGQLTGGVAHDFNNLLAIIMGNLQMIERRGLNDVTRERLLQPALRASRRGAELTRQLLAFGRRQVLHPVPTRLTDLIADLRSMLARTLGETITLDWEFAPDLAYCKVDPAQLESAILNLVLNARDAMPNGGKIVIHAHNTTVYPLTSEHQFMVPPGKYVTVAVSDEGHGMTPEVQAKVFEPFFTTKGVGQGSGLGLSMVYGFVKQSGGYVTIDSAPNEGTRVTLFLPQSDAPLVAAAELNDRTETSKFSGTVLIVEDQDDVSATAINLFEELGFHTHAVSSGSEALSFLQANTGDVDLLFCDVVLGNKMSGPELATQARQLYPRMKVLFVSGYAEGLIAPDFSRNSDFPLLDKPYSSEELVQALAKILNVR